MLLLTVLAMGTLAIAVSLMRNTKSALDGQQRVTREALTMARDTLLAYALMEDSSPGSFPCPDQQSGSAIEGIAAGAACKQTEIIPGRPVVIGRLPWKTLGIAPLRDAAGECLWYMLSAYYRDGIALKDRGGEDRTPALNPNLLPAITVYRPETHALNEAVAVIFAPGKAIGGQNRGNASGACNSGDAANFLEAWESFNNATGPNLINMQSNDHFNDQLIVIDRKMLFDAVIPRIVETLAVGERNGGLQAYLKEHPGESIASLATPATRAPLAGTASTVFKRNSANREDIDFKLLSYYFADEDDVSLTYSAADPENCVKDIEAVSEDAKKTSDPFQLRLSAAHWLCRNNWYDFIEWTPVDERTARLRYYDPNGQFREYAREIQR